MSDDDLGRHFYNYTNRGWPAPTGWENLSEGAKQLWIERALRQKAHELVPKKNERPLEQRGETRMVKTFFTSDLHFFHENVIRFCNRPFDSVEQMNGTLVKNWNSVVGEGDHVWMLGDFSFGKDGPTIGILNQLKGIKHLIIGNHDRKGSSDRVFNRDWNQWFVDRNDYLRLKVDKQKLVLCHFPFSSWERGYINLHGHLHNHAGYKNKWRQYDVGVDANNYTPILLEDVVKLAEGGEKQSQ